VQTGNLFVNDTDFRKCNSGAEVDVGNVAGNLVAQDSRFAECGVGVELFGFGALDATGLVSNCTVSGGLTGFLATSGGTGNVDLTLIGCRSVRNQFGLALNDSAKGNVTMLIANCMVTGNTQGIFLQSAAGTGTPAVLGTSPGSNFISGNTTDGSTTGSVTLANWLPRPLDQDRLRSKSDPALAASAIPRDRRKPEEVEACANSRWTAVWKERT
jgi:hypothetical protein